MPAWSRRAVMVLALFHEDPITWNSKVAASASASAVAVHGVCLRDRARGVGLQHEKPERELLVLVYDVHIKIKEEIIVHVIMTGLDV